MEKSALRPFIGAIKDSLASLNFKDKKGFTLDSYVLNDRLKSMKVQDAMYHLNRSYNLPTLALQDALMSVLRYTATANGLNPDKLAYGINDANELVILHDGRLIGRPEMKDGVLQISSKEEATFAEFKPVTNALSVKDSEAHIKDALKTLREKGYSVINVKGLNVHLYKTKDDSYDALVNGTVPVEDVPIEYPEMETLLSEPNNIDFPQPAMVVLTGADDPATIDLARQVCVELRAIKSKLKKDLFCNPTVGLDEYFNFYRSYLCFALYVKSLGGDFTCQDAIIEDFQSFVQSVKVKLDALNSATCTYRGLNQAICDILYSPIFKYCI